MPNLSALFTKFLFRETLTAEEKTDIRDDIAALKNDAASVVALLEGETPEFAGIVTDKIILSNQAGSELEAGELARSGSDVVLGDGVRIGGRHVVSRSTKGSWRGAANSSPVNLGTLAFTAQEMAAGAIIRVRGSFGVVATGTLPASAYFGIVSPHTESLALGTGALSGVDLSGASAVQGIMDIQVDLNSSPAISGAGYLGLAFTTQPNLGGTVIKTVSGTVSQAVLAPVASAAEEAVDATAQTFKLQIHMSTASGATYNVVWDLEYDVTLP